MSVLMNLFKTCRTPPLNIDIAQCGRPLADGEAYAWPFSVFTPTQVFGPHTAKYQPIWIKFSKNLLLYGIHLWADLDRDRRLGGSRPNQNDYVFVILVTHPKSFIETTDRRDFGDKPSKWM